MFLDNELIGNERATLPYVLTFYRRQNIPETNMVNTFKEALL